jgi:hypothetical protein
MTIAQNLQLNFGPAATPNELRDFEREVTCGYHHIGTKICTYNVFHKQILKTRQSS